MSIPDIFLVRVADKAMGLFKRIGANQHPMNLVYLATWLREHGHFPEIIDLEIETLSHLERRLRLAHPYLVGITAMTPNIPEVKRICNMCNSLGIQTVLGGPHPTALPIQTLKDTGCDYVVIGEGELPLCELLNNIKKNKLPSSIEGIVFFKNGQPVINKRPQLIDVDKLPLPDRRFLRLDRYRGKVTPAVLDQTATIFTSRGCPYACTFCASKVINQQRVRFRNMKKILEEIDDIVALGFRHLNVEDDTFTIDNQRVMEFCSYLIAKYPRISWDCDSRVDAINEKLLIMMKRSNCRKILFGVESGSPRILKSIGKKIDINQIKYTFRLTKKYGILTQALFMIGFLEETPQDIRATEKLIDEIKPDLLHLSTVVPLPGTAIYDEMLEKGYLAHIDWGSFHFFNEELTWHTKYFSAKDLVKIRKRISWKFYSCPSWVFKKIIGVRAMRDLYYLIKGGLVAWKAFYK